MKKQLLILLSVLFASFTLQAQCDFYDDYSSQSGWTQIGTDVQVSNGKVEFLNGAKGGEGSLGEGQKRVYKNTGLTFNSNDSWVAQFEFTPTSVGTTMGQPWTGHTLFALTAGTQEPFNNCTNLACSGFPNGNQDGVIVMYGADNPPTGNIWFKIKARDNSLEYTSSAINANTMGVTYYPSLERLSGTNVQLSVFSDAARTVHIAGSPVSLTIPITLTGLTTVQHGNVVRGNYQRELNGTIDSLCINLNPSIGIFSLESIKNPINLYPNPNNGQFSMALENSDGDALIEVYDLMGKKVFTERNTTGQLVVNIEDQPKGIYFVKVTIGNEVFSEKVVYQ